MKRYKIEEVCQFFGVEDEIIFDFVHKEWIEPVSLQNKEFDEEDLARIQLILELTNKLGVNEGGVPIILHLVDQIHRLHHEIQNRNQR